MTPCSTVTAVLRSSPSAQLSFSLALAWHVRRYRCGVVATLVKYGNTAQRTTMQWHRQRKWKWRRRLRHVAEKYTFQSALRVPGNRSDEGEEDEGNLEEFPVNMTLGGNIVG
jgi:hypothetical protein